MRRKMAIAFLIVAGVALLFFGRLVYLRGYLWPHYTYVVENGQATITRYYGRSKHVVIPEKLGGAPVTRIGDYAFQPEDYIYEFDVNWGERLTGSQKIVSIKIPDRVTFIGEGAFYNCVALQTVTMPKGMTEIKDRTFANCTSLTSVTVPDGVVIIGDNAFDNCASLARVSIPKSVSSVGTNAFYGVPWIDTSDGEAFLSKFRL